MPQKIPLTVTIIASNEESRIAAALESVKDIADEILVVIDDKSSDQTETIALSMGAKVLHNQWAGYGQQKRFAEDHAKTDWILNIDADERVTPHLAKEISHIFTNQEPLADAYWIAIHDLVYGTPHVSPYVPYNRIRLYNKTKGRFSHSPIHDTIEMHPKSFTKQLKGIIVQESIVSFHQWLRKMNHYTDMQAQDLIQKKKVFSYVRLICEFFISFFKAYFMKGFWRSGLMGYIYAMNFAYGRFLRQIKFYEALYVHRSKDSH